jgi:hypothetical protein
VFRYYTDRQIARWGYMGVEVATRPEQRQRNYRDLRERTKRQERSREEHLQRIVELRRERRLHSFQHEAGRTAIAA